jgi:type I restriction enzyme S subunit
VSVVASHWRDRTLGELLEIKHGFAFKGEFFSDAGSFVLLTPGNFRENGGLKLKGDKEKFYLGDYPPEFLLKRGDLLVAMTDLTQQAPILGSPAFIPVDGCFLHNQRLGKFINVDQTELTYEFLFYLMNTNSVRGQILGSATGSTVRHTSPSRIYNVNVQLPPLPVQHRISGILSAYDELIENNERRIEILEAMARAIYQEAVQAGPSAAELKPLVNCSYWRFISENVSAYIGTKRYFATADVDGLAITGPGIDYPFSEKPSRAQKQPIPNSVWFARMKDTYKIAWYEAADEERASSTMLSSGFAGFEAVDAELWPLLFLALSSKEFHVQKDLYCTGATQMALTNEGLARVELAMPDEAGARALGRATQPILREMLLLQRKSENLRRTRDLLLPRLLSGELDVEASAA